MVEKITQLARPSTPKVIMAAAYLVIYAILVFVSSSEIGPFGSIGVVNTLYADGS